MEPESFIKNKDKTSNLSASETNVTVLQGSEQWEPGPGTCRGGEVAGVSALSFHHRNPATFMDFYLPQ